MPYTDRAVWCTAIKIMMRTAKKRGLILAVGGGLMRRPRKGAIFWPFEELMQRLRKAHLFWCCLVYGALSRSSTPYTECVVWCTGQGKVMCKRKPLSAVMYNRGSLCLCGGLRGVRLITPEHEGLYCISYIER